MKLKVKLVHENAVMPRYAMPGDSGLDLCAMENVALEPGEVKAISTGIAVSIPGGYEGQVRPRSGLSSQGVLIILGTVDSGYRGEIRAIMHNVKDHTHLVRPGDRIAQLVITPVIRAELVQVNELDFTVRGDRGFGSTGL